MDYYAYLRLQDYYWNTVVDSLLLIERFELFQNYPNPFNASSTISYQLRADSKVSLKIYNLLGQEVSTLIDADQTAGFHQETWNASSIASGTYIYRLVAKDASGKETVERKTMTLLK
jgi:hypothetical protein